MSLEMAEEIKPPNGWMEKAKAAGLFINQVGIPAVIILFFLIALGAMIFGKVDVPVVTKAQFKEAMERNIEMHTAIVENARANTKALERTSDALGKVVCEIKPKDVEKLACFRDLNKGD